MTSRKFSRNKPESGDNPRNNDPESGNNDPKPDGEPEEQYYADPTTSKIILVQDTDEAAPNLSLNCHDRKSRTEIIMVAIFGVLIQVAVLIYCGFATLKPSLRSHLKKDDEPVRNYAFPLTVCGTVILTVGVLICGIVVERSTNESYYMADDQNYSAFVVWLQKESTISDQDFKPFAIFPTSKRSFITMSRRRGHTQTKTSNTRTPQPSTGHEQTGTTAIVGLELLTTVGCLTSISGFVLQFMGLRGLNYTAAVAQFVAMAIMTILRALVRRGLAKAPIHEKLLQGFELDWLANTLGRQRPNWVRKMETKSRSHLRHAVSMMGSQSTVNSTDDEEYTQTQTLYQLSRKVTESQANNILSIRQQLGNFVEWLGPASSQAILLSEAMEVVGSELLQTSQTSQTFDIDIHPQLELWKLKFSLEYNDGQWKARADRLEAAMSLWMSSMQNHETPQIIRDSKIEWLRGQRIQQLGLQILGRASQNHVLMRNLQFFLPKSLTGSIPQVLDVKEISSKNARGSNLKIPSHRVIGFSMVHYYDPDNTKLRHFEFSKEPAMNVLALGQPIPAIPDYQPYASQKDSSHPAGGPAPETTHQNTPGQGAGEQNDRYIAVVHNKVSLERLFARQMFFSFMEKISEKVQWEEDSSEVTADKDAHDWRNLKISNRKLSRLISRICDTGFLNLEEANFDVIAPLSLSGAMPGTSAILDHMQQQASQCIADGNLRRFRECLEFLFHLATAFNTSDRGSMARAFAMLQYNLNSSEYLAKIAEKEGRSFYFYPGEFMTDTMKLFKATKDATLASLCNVFERQFSIWQTLPTMPPPKRVQTTGKTFETFQLTKFHIWALNCSQKDAPDAPKGNKSDWMKRDIFGWTPIHYLAASGGPWTTGEQLREYLPWSLRYRFGETLCDIFGLTPLHYACARVDVEMVRELLKFYAPIVRQSSGISPLHIAAVQTDAEILRMIISHIKDREEKEYARSSNKRVQSNDKVVLTDFENRAAAHWAAIYGSIDAIELLKTDVDLKDRYGWNCLHLAVMHGHENLVKYLINEVALDVNVAGNDGRTPLHMAIEGNQAATINLLIDKKASINTLALNGDRPFHEAVRRCEPSVVESLIKNGAQINIQDGSRSRCNPLHYATRRGNDEIWKLLLAQEDGQKALFMQDTHGETPLHIMAGYDQDTPAEKVKVISEHLDGDVNSQTTRGQTPLHKAVEKGNAALTKALLSIGAATGIKDSWGQTPLDIANDKFEKQRNGTLCWPEDRRDWSNIKKLLEKPSNDASGAELASLTDQT